MSKKIVKMTELADKLIKLDNLTEEIIFSCELKSFSELQISLFHLVLQYKTKMFNDYKINFDNMKFDDIEDDDC
jgi:hypothetical protein